MKSLTPRVGRALLTTAFVLTTALSAHGAGLTLTAAGIADGFSTSTFAIVQPGNLGCCNGPFGIAVANGGNVIVGTGSGSRYSFNDVDGQTTVTATNTVSNDSFVTAYASAGGQAYGAQSGRFVQFNNDGSVNHVLTGVTSTPYLGMWGNPANGHIIATTTQDGLIDIDPLAAGGLGSARVINGQSGDGVSVSPDGLTVYIEQGPINGYNITSGLLVYSSGNLFPSPDGTGVIQSSNSLNGQIIVNDNSGNVYLLDPTSNTSVIIATTVSPGDRGDYVSPDVSNGTLLLDFGDSVERLSCGAGCGIGSSAVPEPSTVSLFGFAAIGLGFLRRKLRNR